MLGFVYIILNVLTGFVICGFLAPRVMAFTRRTYTGEKLTVMPALLCLPFWYVLGALPMTWLTYLTACLAEKCGAKDPLGVADLIIISLDAFFVFLGMYLLYRNRKLQKMCAYLAQVNRGEQIFAAITFIFAAFLMWWTFSYQDGVYRVGYSVFSDFAPHIGMIRSFSKGSNFPTGYSHFAGEDIKYHFLFQFMVGNLEYLGMRLDWAFNLSSTICLAGAFWLLYVLAVKLTGKRAVGYVAAALFAFRSSDALFDFFAKPPTKLVIESGPDQKNLSSLVWKAFRANEAFVGTTEHEDWGLWNLNVYCNQRHLAIGLCVLLCLVIFLLPPVFSAVGRVRGRIADKLAEFRAKDPEYKLLPIEKIGYAVRFAVFEPDGWLPKKPVRAVLLGLLLGMCSFFNGACVIGCLCVLLVLAVVSDHRLEYAMVAAITVACTLGASSFFIDGSAVSMKYYFGFLAKVRTFAGAWEYIMTLCGILPIVLLAGFLISDSARKWIWIAFAAPFVFAFTVSLTIDITVNHKYIMMSLMLLAIPAAGFLVWIFERAGVWTKITAVFLLVVLTATGIYDLHIVVRKNDIKEHRYLVLDEDDPITNWVIDNSDSSDIFLTPYYSLNNFVFGGAMLYYGWPYYAWSAGYDTDLRAKKVREMYESRSSEDLIQQVSENNIRFIVVDDDCRKSDQYKVNELVIASTYKRVFVSGKTSIYDTRERAESIPADLLPIQEADSGK